MRNRNRLLTKLLTASISVVMLAAMLTGCNSQSAGNQVTATVTTALSQEEETGTAASAASADAMTGTSSDATQTETLSGKTNYPLTITFDDGSQVTLDSEPEKIVSMGPNITETIFALGAGDKLVGRTDYCDYPEEAADIQSVGSITDPDVEKITSLDPDVVIGSTHFSSDTEKKLEDLGIQVIVIHEETEYTGVYDIINYLGQIVNEQDKAASLIKDMKNTADTVANTVSTAKSNPTVYYVVGYGEYGDYTDGGDTFGGQIIKMAGGDNIAEDVSGWSYNLESLIEADPDIIIVGKGCKDDFMSQENYKDLTAVKNGNVYEIDNSLIDRQSYRNAEGLLTLAKIFHPDLFTE
jgi:iron complex transport system substrate-binding protein